MNVALEIYEAFKDDENKAKVLAKVVGNLESRILPLHEAATKRDLSETELRLIKEIETIRSETKNIESNLELKIKDVESNLELKIKDVESNLELKIKDVELKIKDTESNLLKEIEKIRSDTKASEGRIIKWSFLFWISQMTVFVGLGFTLLKVLKVF